jgi:hypothetical protein
VLFSDLTLLVRYRTRSAHRDEIYSYDMMLRKLVNNVGSSSWVKCMWRELRLSSEERACQDLSSEVFVAFSRNKVYTVLA